ncbi:MAG: sensor histidine kinase [Actinomycetota bacterium]
MPSLTELVRLHADLDDAELEWLRLLVGDWQLMSDLAFADLVLWVRVQEGWLAVAHARSTVGTTMFANDVVGDVVPFGQQPNLDQAASASHLPAMNADAPRKNELLVPVLYRERTIAVLARHTVWMGQRVPSPLESAYLSCADLLARMVREGQYPDDTLPTATKRGSPRVGDGMLRLNEAGVVDYATPNALSAFHRLGQDFSLLGESLAEVITPLLRPRGRVDDHLPLVLLGKAAWQSDVEGSSAVLSVRSVPLWRSTRRVGAVLLVRDVTELRRREQELLSKEAAIKEINHRVKNNLQTVAALLRLQSRRADESEIGVATKAALGQAERRVAAIALVHDVLSGSYEGVMDFGEFARRGVPAFVEVARASGADQNPIATDVGGEFGLLCAEDATALSLILGELVQNAVEHGLAGRGGIIGIHANRTGFGSENDHLLIEVTDNGRGMPVSTAGATESSRGLGSQIIRSLVSELTGRITWSPRLGGGTVVRLDFPPRPLRG